MTDADRQHANYRRVINEDRADTRWNDYVARRTKRLKDERNQHVISNISLGKNILLIIFLLIVFFSLFNIIVFDNGKIFYFSDFMNFISSDTLPTLDTSWLIELGNARITDNWVIDFGIGEVSFNFIRDVLNIFMDALTGLMYVVNGVIQGVVYVTYVLKYFVYF